MCFNILGDPPDIDEGPPMPKTKKLIKKDVEVKIGTPVYLVDGYDVTIICDVLTGTRPITIMWFRNGVPDPTRGNVSNITVIDAADGDVFTCMAENNIGFDMKYTLINVTGELMKNFVCTHVHTYSTVYTFSYDKYLFPQILGSYTINFYSGDYSHSFIVI